MNTTRSSRPGRPPANPSTTRRRQGRLLLLVIASIATAITVAAPAAEASAAPTRTVLIAHGSGAITGELPFCIDDGGAGPCGPIVEGSLRGAPIDGGTFFVAISTRQVRPARCTPVSLTAQLAESIESTISFAAEGRLCPTRHGRSTFIGRMTGTAGAGRFADVASASGTVVVDLAADGSASLTVVAVLRVG